jgi:hypothetical protein
MPTYNITNEAPGARGVGSFLIEANSELNGVELAETDALLLSELDGITIKAAKAEKPAKAEARAPDAE